MSDNHNFDFKQQINNEAWEEISALKGDELDQFLISLGLNPNDMLQTYAVALAAAIAGPKRARFEEALQRVRQKKSINPGKILSFDLSKKREILAEIRAHAASTNDMTIAARNQKIDDEGDLDSFLEACLRLGMIDEEGNLL